MTDVVLEMRDLTFAYNGEPVLEGVDLQVRSGEFWAVLGPNGGGKTTLLKLALGLFTPQRGRVRVFGLAPDQARPRVGYVPQHGSIKPGFPITALETALMGLTRRRSGPGYSKQERAQAREALERVDVGHLENARMDELSGGQRQRVLVARALAARPDLLIFDEPTSNIDPQGKFCLFELLNGLSRSITILVVSHDISVTSQFITSVACVNRQLIANNKPELTPSMLSLIYGVHEHSCPMSVYIQDAVEFSQQSKPQPPLLRSGVDAS